MLKFFRKYNKYILVFGGSLLMVVFLLQGTMSMFMPNGSSTPIGTIYGGKVTITAGQQRTASIELDVLNQLGLGALPPLAQRTPTNSDLRYYLMVTSAKRLGLSASQLEVKQVLQIVGADSSQVTKLATLYRSSPEFIYQAVRHWLMIEAYRSLILGHSFQSSGQKTSTSPGIQLLELYSASMQAYQKKQYQVAQISRAIMIGTQRISQPTIAHFLEDVQSRATGKLININSSRYLDKVAQPGKKQLQKLFKKYKNDLPGKSKPYGFGYRIPNRVKFAFMLIPLKQAKQHVSIGEAEAISYYQSHKDEFTVNKKINSGASSQPSKEKSSIKIVKPYSKVRDQIISTLTDKKAQELASRMIKTAQNLLLEDVRPLPRKGGYRVVPDNFSPATLTKIANELEQQFKIKPVVDKYLDHWVGAEDLDSLPVIGISHIGSGYSRHSFSDYVLSAKELDPDQDNALIARRLQVDVPSAVLQSPKGPIIFRLTAAQPTHEPKNLKAVKNNVVNDAKKLEAYKLLLSKKAKILKQVADKGIDDVADAMNVNVEPFKNIPRRISRFGILQVPFLQGVGQNKTVVDYIFHTANSAIHSQLGVIKSKNSTDKQTASIGNFSDIAAKNRQGAIGVSDKLSLALFQIDKYDQLTHKQFNQATKNIPLIAIAANGALQDNGLKNPFSLQALKKRLDFKESQTSHNNKSSQPSNPRPAPIGM